MCCLLHGQTLPVGCQIPRYSYKRLAVASYPCPSGAKKATIAFNVEDHEIMDVSEVVVKHSVALANELKLVVHVNPSVINLAKEFRYCVYAIVVGWTTASIVKSFVISRRPIDPAS